MKTTNKVLGAVVAMTVGMFALPATAELPKPGAAPTLSPTVVQPIAMQLGPAPVPLACEGMGASDVRHRGHHIKNSTSASIPKGTIVHWTSSDKGSGKVTLSADLAPNASIDVIEAGQTNGYSCTATFTPGPIDFAVTSVAWTGATTASVVIKNTNAFVDAPASTVAVKTKKCQDVLVASQALKVPAIPKGGSVTVQVASVSHAGDYLEAVANPDDAVPETNKSNNLLKSADYAQNKSCVPQ